MLLCTFASTLIYSDEMVFVFSFLFWNYVWRFLVFLNLYGLYSYNFAMDVISPESLLIFCILKSLFSSTNLVIRSCNFTVKLIRGVVYTFFSFADTLKLMKKCSKCTDLRAFSPEVRWIFNDCKLVYKPRRHLRAFLSRPKSELICHCLSYWVGVVMK